jgi:hypothetical protein
MKRQNVLNFCCQISGLEFVNIFLLNFFDFSAFYIAERPHGRLFLYDGEVKDAYGKGSYQYG